ncbi:MAG TPA: AbrB/MazE/SpoVT family DNA-binding domain-containing protein [Bacilli bacterium]|nr:AbrB/MazE/SpoVT family DNA-binding domain-containing protein [Bacilli bacterium]
MSDKETTGKSERSKQVTTATAKLSSKGQVTVPVEIRRALEAKEGDEVQFTLREDGVVTMQVLKRKKLSQLFGALATQPEPGREDFSEIRRQALESMTDEDTI